MQQRAQAWFFLLTARFFAVGLVAPLLNSPVYSLATLCEDGSTNMNLVTYASPVGIRPDRRWALSLYRGTVSHENFARRKSGVLQLLVSDHADLTWTLGGSSGRNVSKRDECESRGFAWTRIDSMATEEELLPGCAAYVKLEEVERINCGDHDVSICTVVDSDADVEKKHSTTAELRAAGLISELGRAVEPLPVKKQVLSESPSLAVYENLLSRDECEKIIAYARDRKDMTTSNAPAAQFDRQRLLLLVPLLLAAPIPQALRVREAGGDMFAEAFVPILSAAVIVVSVLAQVAILVASNSAGPLRTSSAAALNDDDLAKACPTLATRIARLLETSVDFLEAPVVSRYEPGQLFATHNDASADPERDWGDLGGQRLKTCIVYLNDVARGGETAFDKLDDLHVKPTSGKALVFEPADAKTGRLDERTTHRSEPAGDEKWICQVWARQRHVPPPLGLLKSNNI